jgi:hypothetical protein
MRVVGSRAASTSLGAVAMLLFACDRSDEQIKVYRIAKAPLDATPPGDTALPTNVSSPSSLPEAVQITPLTAAVPSNWEPQPLSQMRQASFLVRGENGAVADISLVTLGAAAGNVLDNVNRWLSQLAQPPIPADKLASIVQPLHTARGDVPIVDLTGQPENGDATKDGRIIAAIASDEGRTSFFKMRGNAALVSAEKENFLKWVGAMRSGSRDVIAESAPSASEKPQIKWELPAGWSPGPGSAMRYASFTATGDTGDKIDISVVTFPGDGGSDADNINRWRQQIGLPPTDKRDDVIPLKSADITFSTIDIAGANGRTLAAWTRRDSRTWFLKLTGPPAAVEEQRPNFVKFVQSVRF